MLALTPTTLALLKSIEQFPREVIPKYQLIDHAQEEPEPFRAAIAAAMERVPALGLDDLHRPGDPEDWASRSRHALPGAVAEFAAGLAWLTAAGRGPARRDNTTTALCGLLDRHLPGRLPLHKHGALIAAALALRYRWQPVVERVDGDDLSVVLIGAGTRLGTPPARPRPNRKRKVYNPELALIDPDNYF